MGAGPAGTVLAALLARRRVPVTLLRDARPRRALLGEVIPPPVRAQLDRIGLGDVLRDSSHHPVPATVSAWGSETPLVVDHLLSPYGDAVQLDRGRFEERLVRRASEDGARVVDGPRTAWRDLVTDAPGIHVVVDSTGRVATVARAHGARPDRRDRLVAVLGILGTASRASEQDRRVLVAATPDGWWVSTLLPDGRRIGAFHTDHDLLDERLRTDPRAWLDRLLSVPLIGSLVGRFAPFPPDRLEVVAADSRRLRWPQRDDPAARGRGGRRPALLAVGDADMAFDPLSSGGIGAAVTSAEEAVPVIEALLGSTSAAQVGAAVEKRAAAADARWRAYDARLREAYGDERRWLRSPFWSRRNGGDGDLARR